MPFVLISTITLFIQRNTIIDTSRGSKAAMHPPAERKTRVQIPPPALVIA